MREVNKNFDFEIGWTLVVDRSGGVPNRRLGGVCHAATCCHRLTEPPPPSFPLIDDICVYHNGHYFHTILQGSSQWLQRVLDLLLPSGHVSESSIMLIWLSLAGSVS